MNLLVFHLCVSALLPVYVMFGLPEDSPIGLKSSLELYIITGLFYASQLGSMLGTSRSLYGHLIPVGDESKFFGLYEVTDKGSSWCAIY